MEDKSKTEAEIKAAKREERNEARRVRRQERVVKKKDIKRGCSVRSLGLLM